MKGSEVLRLVDQMHHEKNVDREIIFSGIEAAVQLAAVKKYGEESGVVVTISRDTGDITARKGEEDIDPGILGRIAAQSAKQVMIQKIREAECNAVFDEYAAMKGDLVHGAVITNPGMPAWWPEFCSAYDFMAAAYLAWLLKSGRVRAVA